MPKRIAIVGCGNVGSFHLMACTGISEECHIDIVEPDPVSVETARKRIAGNLADAGDRITVKWLNGIDQLKSPPDLTIIATLSTGRADMVRRLIQLGHRNLVIEKMVCQSADEYECVLENARDNNVKAWVNCPNRYVEFHRQQAFFFQSDQTPLVYTVTAGNVGLGSNAIHFLDMFKWFCNDSDIIIDNRYINPRILPNRRGEDLVEFCGTLIASTQRGDIITINFLPDSDLLCSVKIVHDKRIVTFSETDPDAYVASRETDFKPQPVQFQQPYASVVTTRIVNDFFSTGSCLLPTVSQSYPLHRDLFEAFNEIIESSSGKKTALCPIT